jgi:hypothetical protein
MTDERKLEEIYKILRLADGRRRDQPGQGPEIMPPRGRTVMKSRCFN